MTAKALLENIIDEYNNKYPPDNENKKDFNYGEKLLMNHALNHLNAVINKNDPPYIDSNGITRHQSDIVKNALVEIPEQEN